jgi:CheY-like chemotaxis protein
MTRILVVDDEPDVVEVIAEILRVDGYDVAIAGDGAEALVALSQGSYDAILSDVVMPVLDGFGLYSQLLALRPALAKRMVFMAARFDAVDQLHDAGLPVLAKPFDIPELLRVLRGVLGP